MSCGKTLTLQTLTDQVADGGDGHPVDSGKSPMDQIGDNRSKDNADHGGPVDRPGRGGRVQFKTFSQPQKFQ